RWSRPALRIFGIVGPLAAIGLGAVSWVIAGLGILLASRAAAGLHDSLFGRFLGNATGAAEKIARQTVFVLAFVALTVLAVAASERLFALFAAIMVLGLSALVRSGPEERQTIWTRLGGSHSLLALAALIALPFSALIGVLALWNLALLGLLLWMSGATGLARPGKDRPV
ncbi:hypothetical protein, partial [Blastomonas sp.]|uniref:hypothetical protein n=1 Tax=Blastomonas sp. TaxID=1909299 RepID=UPI0035942D36